MGKRARQAHRMLSFQGQAEWSGVAGAAAGEGPCVNEVSTHRHPRAAALGVSQGAASVSELGCPRPLGTAMSQTLAPVSAKPPAFRPLPTPAAQRPLSFLGLAAWLVLTASGRSACAGPCPPHPSNPFCFHSRAPARACHLPPPPPLPHHEHV